MKIKEYIVVGTSDHDDIRTMVKAQFSEKINGMIAEGWQPIGGISCGDGYGGKEAFQSMVKYDESTGWTQPYLIKPKNKEKKLVDFSVSWHSTSEYMNRNEKDFIEDGWETFKKESLEHGDGLMCHKLMMVKYE